MKLKIVNGCNENNKTTINYKDYKFSFENVSINPTLTMQNTQTFISNQRNKNNHRLKEISYKNKKNDFIAPKPSILPVSQAVKNNIYGRFDHQREIHYNSYRYFNKELNNYFNNIRKSNLNEDIILNINNNKNECDDKKGRNSKNIRTQENTPSIIKKKNIS